jgi:hypothetical protein
MTAENKLPPYESKKMQLIEEICENTRAIRRVNNRILDHLHEYQTGVLAHDEPKVDTDEWSWDDLDSHDDMFF